MKRRLAIVLLLLAGGAVVNVAVAWGLSISMNPWHALTIRNGSWAHNAQSWDVTEMRRFGARTIRSHRRLLLSMWRHNSDDPSVRGVHPQEIVPEGSTLREFRPTHLILSRKGETSIWRVPIDGLSNLDEYRNEEWTGFVSDSRIHNFQGWPLLTLSCEVIDSGVRGGEAIEGGILAGMAPFQMGLMSEPRVLPLRPIWPGFIINTLFYALLLWLLFFAPITTRRMLRRRRGVCEKCAYPIGISAVCTECGAAVPRKVEA